MTDSLPLSRMSVAQLHHALRTIDVDWWSAASEAELAAAYERCLRAQSSWLNSGRSASFLFPFSMLLVAMLLLGSGRLPPWPWSPGAVFGGLVLLLLASAPLAGMLRLLLDAQDSSEAGKQAAWVAHQLRPLAPDAPVAVRMARMAESSLACAAYQRQLVLRGRAPRLLDLGAMVVLTNRAQATRQSASH